MLHLAAILLALGAGLILGRLQSPAASGGPRIASATLATAVIVAAMFAAQLAFPSLLPLLAREPSLWHGQLWRAVTALFVQDSGPAGALANLAALLLIGSVAERRLGWARWFVVYFGGGVITEFLALAWQPRGAGNSIACFALAGGLTLRAVNRTMGVRALCMCVVGVGAAVVLLLLRDIHGIGFWAGMACAFSPRRRPANPPRH
jgi:membrane associated rhomboid family serine protease